jgi:hypothetical protein
MYRLIRDDYKTDGAELHFASVSEMIGLCMLMNKRPPEVSEHAPSSKKKKQPKLL